MPDLTSTKPERTRCRHIHADGRRCGSPCLRSEPFCYFHHTSRKPIARPEARRGRRSAFDLPLPEDRTAIQLSIGEILRRIATNDVDPRRAGLLLYGLQIASTNLAQSRNQARVEPTGAPAEEPVEELTVDPALGPLAPHAPFTPAPESGSGKPTFLDILLDRLQTLPDPHLARDPHEPQTAPVPVSPPGVAPVVLPTVQASIATPPRLQWRQPLGPHPMPTLRLTLATLVLFTTACAQQVIAQQVIQRGPLGTPAQVLDDTNTWTSPFLAVPAKDVEIYLPDVSSQVWLKKNYQAFIDRGQYILTVFTRYRSPEACRANQIGWGLGDQAHLDACATDIAYRVRTATVDTNLKTVTLISAAMVDPDGNLDPASVQNLHPVRRWQELDPNTQKALELATAEITKQMARYDRRVQSLR